MRPRAPTFGMVVLAAAALGACGTDRDATLVVRTTLADDLRDYVEDSFEGANPTIDLQFTEATDLRSLEELHNGGAVSFDVWWGASAESLERAASAGLLLPYRPPWVPDFEGSDESERSDEHLWHPTQVTPFVIAFNRQTIPIARAPLDWPGVFHHRWFEGIFALDPTRSEEGAYFLGAVLVEILRDYDDLDRGFDWFTRLESQIVRWVGQPQEAIRALRSDEPSLAIVPRADAEAARSTDAAWLHYRLPASGTPVLARGVAIVRGTDLEDAARRFVDHVGSVDVVTEAKLLTRWEPAYGDVDVSRIPIGFEIDTPWTPYPFATDTLVSELGGWVSRWEVQVRAR